MVFIKIYSLIKKELTEKKTVQTAIKKPRLRAIQM